MEQLKNISFSIVLVLVGAIFIILGLSSGIILNNYSFVIQEIWARFTVSIVGVILIAIAMYFEIKSKSNINNTITKNTSTNETNSSTPKPPSMTEGKVRNLIISSDRVPMFTRGQSRLTANLISNTLIVDFSNSLAWSGIAFKFTPALDVRGFSHLNVKGVATKDFTFRIEYKLRVEEQLRIVAESEDQLFSATTQVQTIQIPLRYDGTVNEITLMFYVKRQASRVDIESIHLS